MEEDNYSKLIKKEDIYNWEKGKAILLDGGTGTGKTYFIVKTLAEYCNKKSWKILYLCNRAKLREDVFDDTISFNTDNIVKVTTYQALENKLARNETIEYYDFIVCDECHYIYNDAGFGDTTDLILKYIISNENSIVILMSATANSLKNKMINLGKLKNENIYTIEKDYSYVKKIELFYGKNNLKKIIDLLYKETNDKIIYFANSVKDAYEIYKKYKEDSYFYCSKSNKTYSKYSDYDCIKFYNKNKITFNKRILITTSVLDNGITLKDYEIKHIITDILDINKMIQCLGRKRIIDDNDFCNFYIKKYSKGDLGHYKGRLMKELKPAMLFKENKENFFKEYIDNEKARKFKNEILYCDREEWKINETRYIKYLSDICDIEMIEKITHKRLILNHLGDNLDKNVVSDMDYEKEDNESNLEEYLNSIVGKKLFREEQKELKEAFAKCGLKSKRLGINTLKGYLIDNNKKLPFILDNPTPKPYRDINGKVKKEKVYWIVGKISY